MGSSINNKMYGLSREAYGSNINRVKHSNYLGSHITEPLDPGLELKCKIETGRITFLKLKTILSSDKIKLNLHSILVQRCNWYVLLYIADTQIIKAAAENKLEAFEIVLE